MGHQELECFINTWMFNQGEYFEAPSRGALDHEEKLDHVEPLDHMERLNFVDGSIMK